MIKLIWKRAKPWCIPLGLALIIYILMRYVFLIGYVPTASMEPTLPRKSFIFGVRIFDEPQVGDIVVFEKNGILMVKRIVAGPGDEVNLSKLSYMTTVPIPVWDNPVFIIPDDCYFVLGDNTQNSWDSRYWKNPLISKVDIVAILFQFRIKDIV